MKLPATVAPKKSRREGSVATDMLSGATVCQWVSPSAGFQSFCKNCTAFGESMYWRVLSVVACAGAAKARLAPKTKKRISRVFIFFFSEAGGRKKFLSPLANLTYFASGNRKAERYFRA